MIRTGKNKLGWADGRKKKRQLLDFSKWVTPKLRERGGLDPDTNWGGLEVTDPPRGRKAMDSFPTFNCVGGMKGERRKSEFE